MLFKRKHLRLKVCIFGYCFCGSPLPESNFLEILPPPLGLALASTWQNQLRVRDCQKRCIAETLVKLSATSLQKSQAKSKEAPCQLNQPEHPR